MNVDAELIIAASGLIAAIYAAIANYRTSRSVTRRDEMVLLREEVVRLQKRVEELELDRTSLHARLQEMTRENQWLRQILRQNGISIPPVPEDFLWGRAEGEARKNEITERRKVKR